MRPLRMWSGSISRAAKVRQSGPRAFGWVNMRSETVGKVGTVSTSRSASGSESEEVGQRPGAGVPYPEESEKLASPSAEAAVRPGGRATAGMATGDGTEEVIAGWSHWPHVGVGTGSEYHGPSVSRKKSVASASTNGAEQATARKCHQLKIDESLQLLASYFDTTLIHVDRRQPPA